MKNSDIKHLNHHTIFSTLDKSKILRTCENVHIVYLPILLRLDFLQVTCSSNATFLAAKESRHNQVVRALPHCWQETDGDTIFLRKDLAAALHRVCPDYDGWLDTNADKGTTLYEMHHDKGMIIAFGGRSGKYKVTALGLLAVNSSA